MSGRTVMSVALMLISGGVFVKALQWPMKTAIFPMTIAVFVFALASLEVFLALYLKQTAKEDAMDFRLAGAEDLDIDEATANKRVMTIFFWIFFFLALIFLLGFPVAIPIYFVVFLKTYGKETWKMTVLLSALAWGAFYGLFVWMLHIPFGRGWIIESLTLLGYLK